MSKDRFEEITGKEKYWAFISYRHADNKPLQNPAGNRWADWLHAELEGYAVPSSLLGKKTRSGEIGPRLLPCFKDEAELPTHADLGNQIREALNDSRYLIVICSPRAVQSKYVDEEIRHFKSLGREHRILPLIVAGEPNAGGKIGFESVECFPQALRFALDSEGRIDPTRAGGEPIAADARDENGRELKIRDRASQPFLEKAKLKLIAGLLGVGFDDLFQREQQRQLAESRLRAQRLRRLVGAFALLSLFALGGAGVAFWQKGLADRRKREAEDQRERALHAAWRSRIALGQNFYDRAASMRDAARPQAALAYLVAAMQAAPKAELPPGFPTTWDSPGWPAEAWRMALAIAPTIPRPKLTLQHSASPLGKAVHHSHPDAPFPTIQTFGEDTHLVKTWNALTGALVSEAEIPGTISSVHPDPLRPRAVLQLKTEGPLLWDTQNNVKLRELPLPDAVSAFLPYRFAFGPGNLIAGGSWTHLLLWNGATGELLWSLNTREASSAIDRERRPLDLLGRPDVLSAEPDNFGHVSALAISADEKYAAFCSGELIVILDVEKRAVARDFGIGKAQLHTLAFLPHNSTQIVLAGLDRNVSLLDIPSGTVSPLARADFHFLRDASLDPHGKKLALALGDGSVQFFDLASGREQPRLEGHGIVSTTLLGPDLLLATTVRGTAHLFPLEQAGPDQMGIGHSLDSVAISEDGKEALVSEQNYTSRYDLQTGKVLEEIAGPSSPNLCRFSPDGKKAVHFNWNGRGLLWNLETGAPLIEIAVLPRQVRTADFVLNGSRLIVCTNPSREFSFPVWQVFDTATGKEILRLAGPEGMGSAVRVWNQGRAIFTGATRISTADPLNEERISKDPKDVCLFDIATGDTLGAWEGNASAAFATSPDAIAIALPGGAVSVRSREGTEICGIAGSTERVAQKVEFSPDGAHLALWIRQDKTESKHQVEVYRIPSGDRVLSLPSPDEPQFKFSSDSSTFLAECATGLKGAPVVSFFRLSDGQNVLKVKADLSDQKRQRHFSRAPNGSRLPDVCPVVLDPDRRQTLIAHGEDVVVVSLPNAEVLEIYPQGKNAEPISIATDSSGRLLAALCDNGTLRLYNRGDQTPIWSVIHRAWAGGILGFSEGLLCVKKEECIYLVRITDGSLADTLPRMGRDDSQDSLQGDFPEVFKAGKGIAFRTDSGRHFALIKNLGTNKVVGSFEAPATDFSTFQLSPNGSSILVGYTGVSELRDASNGKLRHRVGSTRYRSEDRTAGNPSGLHWRIERNKDHSDRILETDSTGNPKPWPVPLLSLNDLATNLDASILLAAHQNKLSLWDTGSRRQIREFTGHISRVNSARIAANTPIAVTGSDDGSVFLWDLATGQPIVRTLIDSSAPVLKRSLDGAWRTQPVEAGAPSEKLRRVTRVGFVPGSGRIFAVSAPVTQSNGREDGDNLRLHLITLTAHQTLAEPVTADESEWSVRGLSELARLRVETEGSRRGAVVLLHDENRLPAKEEEALETDSKSGANAKPVRVREWWELEAPTTVPGPPPPDPVGGSVEAMNATLMAEAGNPAGALEAIHAVVATHPAVLEHRLLRLELLESLNRGKEALEQAHALAAQFPDRAEVQTALADLLESEGDKEGAVQAWLAAARSQPTDGTPHMRAALLLAQTGRHKEALKEAEAGVALRAPSDRWSRVIQSWCLLMADKPAQAQPILESLTPGGSSQLLSSALATLAWKKGSRQEALREYSHLVATQVAWITPGHLASLGYVNEPCRQTLESVRTFFLQDPESREGLIQKAEIHKETLLGPLVLEPWQAGDRSRAVAHFEEMIRRHPQLAMHPESLKHFPSEALAVFAQARALAEKYSGQIRAVRAEYPVDLGEGWADEALARSLTHAAEEALPEEARRRAWVNAGWLQLHRGQCSLAMDSWAEALRLVPLHSAAWADSKAHLQAGQAIAAAQMNNLSMAAESLGALIVRSPDFLDISTIKRDFQWPVQEFEGYEKMLLRMRSSPLRHTRPDAGYAMELPFPWLPVVHDPSGLAPNEEILDTGWDLRLGQSTNNGILRFGARRLRVETNVEEYLGKLEKQELDGLEDGNAAKSEIFFAGGKWSELSITAPGISVVYRVQLGTPMPLEIVYVATLGAAKDKLLRERTFAGFHPASQ